MKPNEDVVHCHLMRFGAHYHCWLPKRHAIVGKLLDIDKMGNGWKVIHVWATLPVAKVIERDKQQRKASDL